MKQLVATAGLALALFSLPAAAQEAAGDPPPPPPVDALPPPLPAPGAFLGMGAMRTVRLTIETPTPNVRLLDVGRGMELCAAPCGVVVPADPTQRYLLRQDGWEDSESFNLSRFTQAVVVSYLGPNLVMRKVGLGLLIGGIVAIGASAVAWAVAFVWVFFALFGRAPGLETYVQIMGPVTAVVGSVGAASLVTGALLRLFGGQTRVELREAASASP